MSVAFWAGGVLGICEPASTAGVVCEMFEFEYLFWHQIKGPKSHYTISFTLHAPRRKRHDCRIGPLDRPTSSNPIVKKRGLARGRNKSSHLTMKPYIMSCVGTRMMSLDRQRWLQIEKRGARETFTLGTNVTD